MSSESAGRPACGPTCGPTRGSTRGPTCGPVYFDHNATTPAVPEAVASMLDALRNTWANPSSTHRPGQAARRLLVDSRQRVATFLGCQPAEIVFTSGATEANHAAVLGAVRAGPRRRLVLSAVEHPGLLALAQRLRGEGVRVDLVPVDRHGQVDVAAASALIGEDVALVSVMGANNETGVLMPLDPLVALSHRAGAWFHVDATQLAGKAPLSFGASGADLMSVSAHKLGGPRGVGALLVRKGLALAPLFSGSQERHRRGGTENLPGIAGFAAACADIARTLAGDIERMGALRSRLERGLRQTLPAVHVYGAQVERLCNTTCVRFGSVDAERVLGELERAGFVASSGAACTSGGTQPSHVLLAMGEPPAHARAGVRFSLARETTAAQIDALVAAVGRVIQPLVVSSVAASLAEAAAGSEPEIATQEH